MSKKIKIKPKLNKSANSEWEIVDDIPMAQDGKKIPPKYEWSTQEDEDETGTNSELFLKLFFFWSNQPIYPFCSSSSSLSKFLQGEGS